MMFERTKHFHGVAVPTAGDVSGAGSATMSTSPLPDMATVFGDASTDDPLGLNTVFGEHDFLGPTASSSEVDQLLRMMTDQDQDMLKPTTGHGQTTSAASGALADFDFTSGGGGGGGYGYGHGHGLMDLQLPTLDECTAATTTTTTAAAAAALHYTPTIFGGAPASPSSSIGSGPCSPSTGSEADGEVEAGDYSGGETTPEAGKPTRSRGVRTKTHATGSKGVGAGGAASGRGGWKCSAEFLLKSITPEERAQLLKSGLELPPVEASAGSVPKARVASIRKAVRKIRNVKSAQKSRKNQKEYIGQLEASNATLQSANSSLVEQLASLRALLAGSNGPALMMVAICCGIGSLFPGLDPSGALHRSGGGSSSGGGGSSFKPTGGFRSRTLQMTGDAADDGAAGMFSTFGASGMQFWLLAAAVVLATVALAAMAAGSGSTTTTAAVAAAAAEKVLSEDDEEAKAEAEADIGPNAEGL